MANAFEGAVRIPSWRVLRLCLWLGLGTPLAGHAAGPADAEELAMWERVSISGDAEQLSGFLQRYPDSERAGEAKALMLDALMNPPEPAVAPVGEAASPAALANGAPASAPDSTLRFDTPLAGIDPADSPRSIEELRRGSPVFAPIEGLPEELWKGAQCSDCHQWDQATLCTQGNFYVSAKDEAVTRLPHPYGGFFKAMLKRWAAEGCE